MSGNYDELCLKASLAHRYRILPQQVAPLRRAAADFGARFAAARCEKRWVPPVRFFHAAAELGELKGSARVGGSEVLVADGQSAAATCGAAAHEAGHCFCSDDEVLPNALQREAAAAWRASRYQERDKIRRSLEELYERVCPRGLWEGTASAMKAADWYGGRELGFDAAILLADADLGVRLNEFQQLERGGLGDPHAHLTIEARQRHARAAAYSYEDR